MSDRRRGRGRRASDHVRWWMKEVVVPILVALLAAFSGALGGLVTR